MLNQLILGQALIRTPQYRKSVQVQRAGVREWITRHLSR